MARQMGTTPTRLSIYLWSEFHGTEANSQEGPDDDGADGRHQKGVLPQPRLLRHLWKGRMRREDRSKVRENKASRGDDT